MNFNGLNDLNYYIGSVALAIMFVTSVFILLGLKFRSSGYKIFVLLLTLGTSVLAYFCFRHEMNFPIIGSLFLIETAMGIWIIFVKR
jgi:CHASE2 domain-containing sensor protein